FQTEFPHELVFIDVSGSNFLRTKLLKNLPRLELGDLALQGSFDSLKLAHFFAEASVCSQKLESTSDLYNQMQALDVREKRGLFLRRHYPFLIAGVLSIYLGLALLAPI